LAGFHNVQQGSIYLHKSFTKDNNPVVLLYIKASVVSQREQGILCERGK